jgi:hypothetical protein
MVRACMHRFSDLIAEGRTPQGTPSGFRAFARGETVSPREYLALDDNTLWTALQSWSDDHDTILSSLARAALDRDLFKTASLDEYDPSVDEELRVALEDIVRRRGFDPKYYAIHDVAEVFPYEVPATPDAALKVVYQRRPPRALESASFMIGRLMGAPFVRRRLIFPGAVRDDVEALLQAHR